MPLQLPGLLLLHYGCQRGYQVHAAMLQSHSTPWKGGGSWASMFPQLFSVCVGSLCLGKHVLEIVVAHPAQICWRCGATKGNSDFSTVYTDFSATAGWRLRAVGEPWETRPFLVDLWGWTPDIIGIDLLHVLFLGVFRDLCGSAIRVLIQCKDYFSGSTIALRFKALTREMRAWSKRTGTPLQIRRLKKSSVNWKSDVCPELHTKAADCGSILKFLVHKVQEKEPPAYQGMTASLWGASNFAGVLMSADMWLSEEERASAIYFGRLFVRSYLELTAEALAAGHLLWKVIEAKNARVDARHRGLGTQI